MEYEITIEEKEIIKYLKNNLDYELPTLTQDRFDNLVDYIIANEESNKELLWRLCGNYDESTLNFNKVIDYYIDLRDDGYLAELISYMGDSLDYQHLVNKMIEINDKEFYQIFVKNYWSMIYGIIDYYYEKQLEDFYNQE